MGATLALAMYEWAPIVRSHRAMAVLAYMALRCLDNADGARPAATYWGGHRPLAQALGYLDVCALEVEPSPSQLTEVGNVIRTLRDVGAIEVIGRAAHGRAATYHLHRRPVDKRPPPPP